MLTLFTSSLFFLGACIGVYSCDHVANVHFYFAFSVNINTSVFVLCNIHKFYIYWLYTRSSI